MNFSFPPKFQYDDGPALWQNPYEFYRTIEVIKSLETKSLLEIGTGWGLFARYLRACGIFVVSIDKSPLIDGLVSTLVGESQSEDAYDWAKQVVSKVSDDCKYDIVYVDGAHDYRSCLADFNMYIQLAKKAVIIHDIDGNQSGKYPVEFGPNKVWELDIIGNYNTMEIHAKEHENCGVGIVLL